METSKVNQYLQRIKLNNCATDFNGLKKLQQHHLLNIPFENLNVVVGRPIHIDHDSLYRKIVQSKRGGYCFELNTIYAELLSALGFKTKPVLGRVWLRNPEKIPARNHLAHLVELNGEIFVTDVGFGGLTTRVPLNINDPSEVHDNDGIVRIIPFDVNQFMIQRKVENEWANQYSFDDLVISEEDIQVSNYYMSTNPNSHFYKDKAVGKFTKEGRIGLFNNQMSIRKGIEVIEKKEILIEAEWIDVLRNQFGIELDFSKEELGRLF